MTGWQVKGRKKVTLISPKDGMALDQYHKPHPYYRQAKCHENDASLNVTTYEVIVGPGDGAQPLGFGMMVLRM